MCRNGGITGLGVIPDRAWRGALAVLSLLMERKMERISVIILEGGRNDICRISDKESENLRDGNYNSMGYSPLVVSFL